MLGMQQAGVSQARNAQTQLLMAAAAKKKQEEEQMRQWATSKGFDPNMPEWALRAKYEQSLQAPKAPSTTGGMQWDAATQTWKPIPGWQAGMQVNMGNPRAVADEIELETIKGDAAYYRDQATGADKAIQSSRQGLNLMKQGSTGRWEPVKGAAAAWAGVDPSAAATYDMWRDYATTQALDTLQQFKGPTTDFEFGVARDLAVQQGKSDFANFVALKAQERGARRTRAKRAAYSEWVSKHRQKFPDFEQWFEEKKNPYPAWDLPEFEKAYREFRGPGNVEQRNQGYMK